MNKNNKIGNVHNNKDITKKNNNNLIEDRKKENTVNLTVIWKK